MEAAAGNILFVGVDGSDIAHQAFELVEHNLFKPDQDTLIVAHVYNKAKDYLSSKMLPENIKATYEAQVLKHGKRAKYIHQELQPGLTTKEHISQLAEKQEASYIVVGWHGRKGPKS